MCAYGKYNRLTAILYNNMEWMLERLLMLHSATTLTTVMSVIIKSFLYNSRYCMSYYLNRINNIVNGFCTAKYWSEEHIKVNLYGADRAVYFLTCFQ